MVKPLSLVLLCLAFLVTPRVECDGQVRKSGSPEDHLPPNITQLVAFGERPAWSPDGTISRTRVRIAWSNSHQQYPERFAEGESALYVADVVYINGTPQLSNTKEIIRARQPDCTIEAQDFRHDDTELVYTCYRENGNKADVMGVDLRTGVVTTFRKVADEYNEAEGVSPDGAWVLVESSHDQGAADRQTFRYIDIWKLRLAPNGTDFVRMTRFSDHDGHKSSNPVVSPDGKSFAFRAGRSTDPPGVGYGIFVYRLPR